MNDMKWCFFILPVCLLVCPAPLFAAPFFQDGFENGNLSHEENGTGWHAGNWNAGGTVTASADRAHTGEYSMKFHYPGGALDAGPSAEERFSFGTNRTDVYIRYYIWFPQNYVHAYPSAGNNNKFFALWDDEVNYGSGNTAVGRVVELWHAPGDPGISTTHLKGAIDWDTSPLSLGCNLSNNNITNLDDWLTGYDPPFYITTGWLGKWTAVEWHLRTDSGSHDGAYEVWIDGVAVFSKTNMSYAGAPCANNYFKTGYLMGWSNSGYAQNTDFYIDDVVFSDNYIGLVDTLPDTTPPAAPSGLGVQ